MRRSFTISEIAKLTGIPRRTVARKAKDWGAVRTRGSKVWRWHVRDDSKDSLRVLADRIFDSRELQPAQPGQEVTT